MKNEAFKNGGVKYTSQHSDIASNQMLEKQILKHAVVRDGALQNDEQEIAMKERHRLFETDFQETKSRKSEKHKKARACTANPLRGLPCSPRFFLSDPTSLVH